MSLYINFLNLYSVCFYSRCKYPKKNNTNLFCQKFPSSEHRAIPNTNLGCPKAEALAVVGGHRIVEAEQAGLGVE